MAKKKAEVLQKIEKESEEIKDRSIDKAVEERYPQIKDKLDTFKKEVLSKFDKYILGIALLPPPKPLPQSPLPVQVPPEQLPPEIPQKPRNPDAIDLFILVDDAETSKVPKFELKDKLMQIIDKIALDIDKNIIPNVMLNSELIENCYDAKYDILKTISWSLFIYDPFELLAALKVSEIHKEIFYRFL